MCSGVAIGEHARRVANRDAPRRGLGNVDVVVSHCHLADHTQLGASRREQACVVGFGEQAGQVGMATNLVQQHRVGRRPYVGLNVDLCRGL
jgi:hypothetical protein